MEKEEIIKFLEDNKEKLVDVKKFKKIKEYANEWNIVIDYEEVKSTYFTSNIKILQYEDLGIPKVMKMENINN